MKNSNDIISRKPGTSKLTRAKFGPGMLLQHEDMELLNSYTRDLSRLMFRSLFGCGVVCGLVVDTKKECGKLVVTVGSGVAIACSGDPIWVPRDESLPASDECEDEDDKELWVVLCGTSKCCAPRPATCSSGDDELQSVCTREMLGYELRVMNKRPKCVCDCQEKEPPNVDRAKAKKELYATRVGAGIEGDDDGEGEDKDALCLCADPNLPCHKAHYAGLCVCSCSECSSCDCDCVLLARLTRDEKNADKWYRDHSVRRFVRPMLMRDPQPLIDKTEQAETKKDAADDKPGGEDLLAYSVAEEVGGGTKAAASKRGKKASTLNPGRPKSQ